MRALPFEWLSKDEPNTECGTVGTSSSVVFILGSVFFFNRGLYQSRNLADLTSPVAGTGEHVPDGPIKPGTLTFDPKVILMANETLTNMTL